MHVKLLQSCLTLQLHGLLPTRLLCPLILQARILKWVAMSSFRDLPYPGIISVSPALASRFFTTEPPEKPTKECYSTINEKDIMLFAATWVDLEIVIISEVSQPEKEKYNIILLICEI